MKKNNGTIFVGDPGTRMWYLQFLRTALRIIPADLQTLTQELNAHSRYELGLITESTAQTTEIKAGLAALCNSVIVLTERPLVNPQEGVVHWESLSTTLLERQHKR